MPELHKQVEKHEANAELDINPVYFREKSCQIPRYRLPQHGVLARTALQVVRDELILDGNARLALLWRWRARRRSAGLATEKPNLVMGSNVQVCWEKFCRYWDVEPRYVPMTTERYHLGAAEAAALCDENTIGVVAIMGSTMDGSYEPVAGINAALDALAASSGGSVDVPIHVDGASGGFIAPFLHPDLEWDFRVPRVASINTSGYNFLRLGFSGYKHIQQTCQGIALYLSGEIAKLGPGSRSRTDRIS